jgi:hypothetical protein
MHLSSVSAAGQISLRDQSRISISSYRDSISAVVRRKGLLIGSVFEFQRRPGRGEDQLGRLKNRTTIFELDQRKIN